MTQQPERPAGLAHAYEDLPELSETLADPLVSMFFDRHTLRITFAINRADPLKPPSQTAGKRYPVCQLVLTGAAIGELGSRMAQLGATIAQAQGQAGPPN